MMSLPDRKNEMPSQSELLRWIQSQGFVQAQRHVRDQEEIFTVLLDSIMNDTSYVGKVQHLIELCGASYPHVQRETQEKIDNALGAVDRETPTFKTSISKIGTEDAALVVEQSKAQGARSHLPLNSSEHYRIFMESERENSHMRIYLKLVKVIGSVVDDLVKAGLLPKQFASKMREMDMSELEKAVG